MHLCMFLSPVDASSDSLHVYLALVVAVLLRVAWWGGFSSHMFIPTFWCGWHLTIGFFIFTGSIPKPWMFAFSIFSAVSDIDICLKSQLHSWGSVSFSMSPTFWFGVLKLSEIFSGCSHASWLVCPIRYPWGSPILSSGLWPSDHSSVGNSMVFCLYLGSLWW